MLAILIIEAILVRGVFGVLEIAPPDLDPNALVPQRGEPSFFSTFVHELIKVLVGAGLLWMLLFGMDLARSRQRFLAASFSPSLSTSSRRGFHAAWAVLHVLALVALTLCRAKLKGFGLSLFGLDGGWLSAVYGLSFALFAVSALRMWAPYAFWRDYAQRFRLRLRVSAVLGIMLAVVQSLGLDATDLESRYFSQLFLMTSSVTVRILTWFGYHVQLVVETSHISVDHFTVLVGPTCLGYQGMSIALLSLSAYLYVNRANFRFPQALLILPTVVVALFFANCIRIAMLLAIGTSWSVKVAIFGFHSAAGWVSLLMVLMGAVYALNRLPVFSRTRSSFVFDLSAQKARLLPQVVLIGVAVASLLVSPGFEWLYPLRVVIVGGLLIALMPRLDLERVGRLGLPVLVGLAVFLLWIALVPAQPDASRAFATELFSAPGWTVVAWMIFRVIGAVIVVPLAEELAFRGYLMDQLVGLLSGRLGGQLSGPLSGRRLEFLQAITDPRWTTALALIVTSVAFGLLHSAWLAGMVAGLAYGLLKLARGRLMDAVIAHGVTNLLLAVYVVQTEAWSYW